MSCTFIVLTEGFLSTLPVVPDNIHIPISASSPFGLPTTLSFDVEIVWFCMCFICVHFHILTALLFNEESKSRIYSFIGKAILGM